jgi:hypothetical protein
VVPDRPEPNKADGKEPAQAPAQESAQVLPFRQRSRPAAPFLRSTSAEPVDASEPLDDLAQYEQDDESDSYRHRMLMNVIAIAVVAALVGVGVWLADTIADMQKDQDCVLQGRANCAPIAVPAPRNR